MKKPLETIAELWAAYEKTVMSPQAPAIQRAECRRAFYAGIRGWLDMQLERLDPGDEPTEADLKWISERDAELDAFSQLEIAAWTLGGADLTRQ